MSDPSAPAETPSPTTSDAVPPDLATIPADLVRTMNETLRTSTSAPPVEEPPVLSPPGTPRTRHRFIFHGETAEYFRIWIVNTLLTLLTFGIYSAWAKVRKRRYLRGNTELMGHRFDYRAEPRRILIGNVLVALIFIAYAVFGEVYPHVRLGAIGVALLLLPWVIVRSAAFNAHNTVYRGVRFYFRQSYGWTALVYIGQCIFILLTAGFYYPAWVRNRKQFIIGSHRLGDAFFRFESGSKPFYLAYLVSGALMFGAAIVVGLVSVATMTVNGGKVPTTLQLLPVLLVYGFAMYVSKHYVYARLFNHIWNNTRLDDHRFVADLPVDGWLKLQLVNLAAIVGSCGLLYPWAAVRSARLALSHLQFEAHGPVEKISRLGRNNGSAMGDTATEFAGIDLAL